MKATLSNHLVAVSIAASLVAAFSSRAATVIAEKGKSRYSIVVASNAIPSERYAAEELQHYIEELSGARLPIITDAGRPTSAEIVLGENARLRSLKNKPDLSKLGTDGFVLRTEGERVFIAGAKPRGTLYGVYTVLEERFGVRWFTPELEFVPRTNRLSLQPTNETRVPALEYREVFWTDIMRDADFAARHRLNGEHYKLTEKHGGRKVVYFPFVHSFDSLIEPELFAEHPEYFPLINGERKNGYVQRCLSNPGVLKRAIARVRQWIKEHPEATIVSVSQNDTANWCRCDTCKALDEAEESPAASLLQFVNQIAEDIEPDFPNIRIDTLAYQYTRKPPKTLRPRRNVIIRLCSIECCFAHSLEDCPSKVNEHFREDIAAWQPVAPTLYIWDYTPNFSHYQQPFPNFDVLQPNVQFFVNHGVKGLFEQGNYSGGGNGEMGPLRAYVLAELLWNPKTDVSRHINEFVAAYFGNAGPKIHAYMDLLREQVRDRNVHAHIFDRTLVGYLNEPFLNEAKQLLDHAEQAAENDTVRFRVQVARLPIWYVLIAGKRISGDEYDQLLRRFLEIARKVGISNVSEGQTLDQWATKLGAK